MSRYLGELRRSFKLKLSRFFLKGGDKRALQEQVDTHRLFLFTSLHEQQVLRQNDVPAEVLAQQLIEQAQSMSFEQQRTVVHAQLRRQLAHIGSCIHAALGEAKDPRPAATALQLAWERMQQPDASSVTAAAAAAAQAGQLVSQHQLSHLLQQRLGYSLAVRPSLIAHQEAGLGLFVEGQVPPGALLALFPGLVYHKAVYRRMPSYPRIDVGNPYLTARYDGGVVDSLPWGRGWDADGEQLQQQAAGAAQQPPPQPPQRTGLIGRIVAASDGARRPPPPTSWVRATTAEAGDLELLEGRHPLALAHFANHPPAGGPPNTAIASFTFSLRHAMAAGAAAGGGEAAASSVPSSGAAAASQQAQGVPEVGAWLRAYVPNIDYFEAASRQHLLTHDVSCVGLVALAPLPPGAEVVLNYRLSPALLGRPAWYVPVDEAEENNRWA